MAIAPAVRSAPASLTEPAGDPEALRDASSNLRAGAGAIGAAEATYSTTSAQAMDAISGPRAQQLYYYVGKGRALLKNAQSAAEGSGQDVGDYAAELAEAAEVVRAQRREWLALEEERASLATRQSLLALPGGAITALGVLGADPAVRRLGEIEQHQAECERAGEDQQSRVRTARSRISERMSEVFVELDPLEVSMEGKAYEAELFEVRDGLTMQQLGYDSPEALIDWFTGEGLALQAHQLRYSEVVRSGFASRSEEELAADGEIPQDALGDGYFTPGARPGYERDEPWQGIVEKHLGDHIIGELDARHPGLFSGTGSPLTAPYAPQAGDARQFPREFEPLPLRVPFPSTAQPQQPVDSSPSFIDRMLEVRGSLSTLRSIWRNWTHQDAKIKRMLRLFDDWAALRNGDFVDPRHLDALHDVARTTFYNPLRGDSAWKHIPGSESPWYRALVTGKKAVPEFTDATGRTVKHHLAHIQEGVGSPTAFDPETVAKFLGRFDVDPAAAKKAGQFASFSDLWFSRISTGLSMVGDAQILLGGSPYQGLRGDIDQGMAAIGLAGSTATALSSAGLIALGPVAAPIVMGAGLVTSAWGLGNLVYDNADDWAQNFDSWGNAADQWLGDNLGAVGELAGGVLDTAGDAAGGALHLYTDTIDAIGAAWNDLWS
ncbi:hypothetical protein GCM10022261_21870 [Brevibacterium daeguense]|uniref:WXG100 family type VII secretion target n=1 Tax=Brevibacterium daeguense TaxID=909936 RepID=A0ABP8EL36_9MICO|nr:hypothetical protein [Brevibacterium daeguense]